MYILSQSECQIIAIENGMISICSGTISAKVENGIYLELGKYPGKDVSDNSRAQNVLKKILLTKEQGYSTFQMPKDNEIQ